MVEPMSLYIDHVIYQCKMPSAPSAERIHSFSACSYNHSFCSSLHQWKWHSSHGLWKLGWKAVTCIWNPDKRNLVRWPGGQAIHRDVEACLLGLVSLPSVLPCTGGGLKLRLGASVCDQTVAHTQTFLRKRVKDQSQVSNWVIIQELGRQRLVDLC